MTKELLEKIKELEGKVGKDWLNEFQDVASPEVLKEKGSSFDVEISEKLSDEAFELLSEKELSDEELDAVAGGSVGTGQFENPFK